MSKIKKGDKVRINNYHSNDVFVVEKTEKDGKYTVVYIKNLKKGNKMSVIDTALSKV